MSRKPWDIAFAAEPTEVASLRRILRLHLGIWGLQEVVDEAQLCMSELVSNVITHVGPGTPATLAVSMNGVRLRIEVHDPDARALPTLLDAEADSESGRGMALVDAIADQWGVQLHPGRKVTWCELATSLSMPHGYVGGTEAARVEPMLSLYAAPEPPRETALSRLSMTLAVEAVSDLIVDALHWLRAHGCDEEEILDRAQIRFEAQVARRGNGHSEIGDREFSSSCDAFGQAG
ncbi:ATP-binding protein [Streptomyces rishiriensis]|uniref:ATP-binding protein n=1 Tax=Streptomyces rishiriensis TaxID=68264 RepID=UPI0037BCF27D